MKNKCNAKRNGGSAAKVICDSVVAKVGKRTVLKGLSFDVNEGEIGVIVGPSGSGKTTLLRAIAGINSIVEGEIHLGGTLVSSAGVHIPPERRGVGYVAQEGSLFPHLSVGGNVVFGLRRKQRKSMDLAAELLDSVGLPESFLSRMPHQLSGGQQRRVALARALAPRPELILLDEPFNGLDTLSRWQVCNSFVEGLSKWGATSLLVTHDQREALAVSHSLGILLDGRIAQYGDPERIYGLPESAEVALATGEASFVEGVADDSSVSTSIGAFAITGGSQTGPVMVLVRPEQVEVSSSPQFDGPAPAVRSSKSGDLMAATVTNVRYQGNLSMLTLSVKDDADNKHTSGLDETEEFAKGAPTFSVNVTGQGASNVAYSAGVSLLSYIRPSEAPAIGAQVFLRIFGPLVTFPVDSASLPRR